ncbi:putative gustatory receptor 22a [Drosophila tropicalis]|uniref:putative gustatory receptor 22a n=1 Tax=Drosophila tropicalis TaxID=46794 RepID=UPI0035AB8D45
MSIYKLFMLQDFKLQPFLHMACMSITIVQLGALLVTTHLHLAVIVIYRCIWLINRELMEMANGLRNGQIVNPSRIAELHSLYSQLLEINSKLTAIYDYQMTLLMVIFMAANILMSFTAIVITSIAMFRHIRGRRRKIVRFILKGVFYGSLGLGLFPFLFNAKEKQLRRSNWLIAYGLVLNFAFIALLLQISKDNENSVNKEILIRNPLLKYIQALEGIISLSTACLVHLRTGWRSSELGRILNELLLLQHNHFKHFRLDDCPKFGYYVIQKFLSIVFEMLSSIAIYALMPGSRSFSMDSIWFYLVQLNVLLLAMHFHVFVIHIYRFLWIINRQLLYLASELRMGRRVDATRVELLLWLYSRLLDLNSRLTNIYDYQITCTMITLLGANIIIGFIVIILSLSVQKMSLITMVMMFPQAMIINLWDFWLSISICDLAERTGRQTPSILRLFTDMEDLEEDLERTVNEFAWFCSHQQLRFFHCRMFYVNYKTGFQMLITSILYLVFMVQFDYRNLIK